MEAIQKVVRIVTIKGENRKSKLILNRDSHIFITIIYRPLTNYGMEEDADDPKEAAHLDYKYLKSFVGPLT